MNIAERLVEYGVPMAKDASGCWLKVQPVITRDAAKRLIYKLNGKRVTSALYMLAITRGGDLILTTVHK